MVKRILSGICEVNAVCFRQKINCHVFLKIFSTLILGAGCMGVFIPPSRNGTFQRL